MFETYIYLIHEFTKRWHLRLKVRKRIIGISPDNETKLKEVESAILAIVLDDSEPTTEGDLIKNVFKGGNGSSDIFAEKSWSRVVTKNGLFASQSEVFKIIKSYSVVLE